jgi:RNA polymerase sigma factor (sigma-70 family)
VDWLTAVYERHGLSIYRAMLARTRSPHAAEEVAAEAFLRFAAHRPWCPTSGAEHRWLMKTAERIWIDWQRRRLPEPVAEMPERAGPDEAALTVRRLWLKELVASLPVAQREVIRLRYQEDLPLTEVASRLGIAPEAARSRLHRALLILRAQMGEEDESGAGE